MKNRALIVDDEPLAREVIRAWLQPHSEITLLGEATNGWEAVAAIQQQQPDLVFLDVQMPDLDGFGVLHEITAARLPSIIFVTAYDQFAVRAFEVHALDYLLKPFTRARFDQALQRARQQLSQVQEGNLDQRLRALLADCARVYSHEAQEEKTTASKYFDRLAVKESGKVLLLKTGDIDWIEAAGDYVCLHVARKSHLFNESMSNLLAKLDPSRFVRIHRSTVVNLERVKELHPHFNGEYFILLHDGTQLKLSRTYRESLQSLLDQPL
jgi:two-component system LytT family response regulator